MVGKLAKATVTQREARAGVSEVGFWHTGYMEHHEADFFGRFPHAPLSPEAPLVFPCPHCRRELPTPDALAHHVFDGHPFSRPLLLFRGRECGRARLTITDATVADDWTALECESALLNGRPLDPGSLGEELSNLRHTVATVELKGTASVETADLEFAIADPEDLESVDERLLELIRGQQLTMGSIQAFIAASEPYRSAGRYRDGIAIYLYGVLAREESPGSGLERHEYRDRFDEAVGLLHTFDRSPADAICGLVAFHFNQFDQAANRTQSPRVSWAATRLADLLSGEIPRSGTGPAPDRAGLDFVLSDACLEQVLSWTCLPLDGCSESVLDQMEDALDGLEPFDQFKVRLLCAEQASRLALADRGRAHANELRHNPLAAAWARAYVAGTKS